MGLAASQCRLLMLTARLHDTEFQAQTISERRMTLARMTEQIATEYQQKMSNKILRFVYDYDANGRQTSNEILSYSGLTAANSHLVGQYRVTLPDGRIAVPSVDYIPNTVIETSEDEDGNTYYNQISQTQVISALQKYCQDNAGSGKDLSYVNKILADTSAWDTDTLNSAYAACKEIGITFPENRQKLTSDTTITTSTGEEYVVMPALLNDYYFQDALQTGSLAVEKYQETTAGGESWQPYDLLNSAFVEDTYYTEDDAAAEAEYTSKSAMIQSQDKYLEIQLKQVETQHQAAQTEYDSVKKVIDKNIERSFKTFG